MNENLDKIYLNEKASVYISEQLLLAGSLSNYLNKKFLNSRTEIWGYFPKGLSEQDLIEFQYGGKITFDIEIDYSKVILNILEHNEDCVWLIIDNNGDSNVSPDLNVIEDVTNVFYYKDTVLHLLGKKPITDISIKKTFTFGGAYPFIGFITKINTSIEENIFKNSVTDNDIDFLVANISLLILGAYDEEGYLVVEIKK